MGSIPPAYIEDGDRDRKEVDRGGERVQHVLHHTQKLERKNVRLDLWSGGLGAITRSSRPGYAIL